MVKKAERRNSHARVFALLLMIAVMAAMVCTAGMCRAEGELDAEDKLDERAGKILDTMTIKQKVGQVIFVGAPAKSAAQMKKMQYGGYIFFADDFAGTGRKKFKKRIKSIQNAAKINAFTAVDEEGGTVVRVSMYKRFSSEKFKSPRAYYKRGGMKKVLSAEKRKCKMLRSIGLNMNFAPVADVVYNSSDYMWSRSFSSNAKKTSAFISKTVTLMNKMKVVSVLKHFPGYGGNGNTHTDVIRDKRKLGTFKKRDLKPFAAGIKSGCGMIMISHNIVKCLDNKRPASISPKVLKYLRKNMGYDGVIISDSLGMEGVSRFAKGQGPLAVKCFEAGTDLVLSGNGPKAAKSMLKAVKNKKISEERLDRSVLRILKLKLKMGIIK